MFDCQMNCCLFVGENRGKKCRSQKRRFLYQCLTAHVSTVRNPSKVFKFKINLFENHFRFIFIRSSFGLPPICAKLNF